MIGRQLCGATAQPSAESAGKSAEGCASAVKAAMAAELPSARPMSTSDTRAGKRISVRLFERNDTSLAAALIVGIFILFHQPLRYLLDTANDFEREYHLDLIQPLIVLTAVFVFHQYRKGQRAKAQLT